MDEPYIGEVRLMGTTAIPDGWAACDGQLLSIDEHRALYEVLGTTYGGNGRTTFALPDLRGRVVLQAGADVYPLGATGGAAVHHLTTAEMPAHRHRMPASINLASPHSNDDPRPAKVSGVAYGPATRIEPLHATEDTEAPAAGHDNLQPYIGLQFMIAIAGQKPSNS